MVSPGVSVIEDVEVTGEGDGRLKVTWKVAGDVQEVDLAWGRSADGLDHNHVMTVPAGAGQAVIAPERPGAGRGRVYVSIAPSPAPDAQLTTLGTKPALPGPGATIASERRIGLKGPVNFRDLGGYRGRDGRRVRWGRVFRSDALVLDDSDLEEFSGLGIRAVYDLRSETERTATPNRLPADDQVQVVVLPLVGEDPNANPLDQLDSSDGENFLAQLYEHILERSAANFGLILTGLSENERLPAVFHCAAGKDRTGMVAAVLLSILGVSLEDILDDYELTGRYRTTEHVNASMERLGENENFTPEVIAGMLRAPRWAMEAALTKVGERYGGFDGYLTGPAGAAEGTPARLRQLLLHP